MRQRILVADDDAGHRQTVRDILTFWGYAVDMAASGSQAVEHLLATRYDLVVTDLSMPNMSGWQVAAASRATLPPTPVLILTGSAAAVDERRAREEGITLVHKPLRYRTLRAALDKVLAGGQRP